MPSERAILLGLLRFGALSAADKIQVLDDYQAHSDSVGGGPHVWNPCVEVIESLWKCSGGCDDSITEESRQLLSQVHGLTDRILEETELYSALTSRTVFSLPIGQELALRCKQAVERLSEADIEELPFWDLMCYTCD
jgi:hypothetical protein